MRSLHRSTNSFAKKFTLMGKLRHQLGIPRKSFSDNAYWRTQSQNLSLKRTLTQDIW